MAKNFRKNGGLTRGAGFLCVEILLLIGCFDCDLHRTCVIVPAGGACEVVSFEQN